MSRTVLIAIVSSVVVVVVLMAVVGLIIFLILYFKKRNSAATNNNDRKDVKDSMQVQQYLAPSRTLSATKIERLPLPEREFNENLGDTFDTTEAETQGTLGGSRFEQFTTKKFKW